MKEISEPRHAEPHLTESSTIRDFVFGFGDGINTSLGIAAGVGGAKAKGFTGKDLEMVVNKVTSDKKVWLDTMLTEELKLNPDVVGKPLKSALIMFVSFLAGGMLPIIPFFFGSGYSALAIAIGISVTASFIVGAIKSRMAETGIIKGGLEMAGLGTGVALIGFGIGNELASLGIINI